MKRLALAMMLGGLVGCSASPPSTTMHDPKDPMKDPTMTEDPAKTTESAKPSFSVSASTGKTYWSSLPFWAKAPAGSTVVAKTDDGKSSSATEKSPGLYCMQVDLKPSASTAITFSATKDGQAIGSAISRSIEHFVKPSEPPPQVKAGENMAPSATPYSSSEDGKITAINDDNVDTGVQIDSSYSWVDTVYAQLSFNYPPPDLSKLEITHDKTCQSGKYVILYSQKSGNLPSPDSGKADGSDAEAYGWKLYSKNAQTVFDASANPSETFPFDVPSVHQIAIVYQDNGCGQGWFGGFGQSHVLKEIKAFTADTPPTTKAEVAPDCNNSMTP